jgi:LysR family cys regulon transcriptional activator
MKLTQLRYICEVAKRNLNVSEAADALYTSQPGVSKQIRQLEDELGVPIFSRAGKRLTDTTQPGTEILRVAERVLREIDNIRRISRDYENLAEGTLTIATTHTQARYALPDKIQQFRQKYPGVKLSLRQGSPEQICDMAVNGEADIAIATEAVSSTENLIALPCYRWNRAVVTPPNHPLLDLTRPLTLADIAQYPIVTYDFAFAGRNLVNKAFKDAKLTPNVVLTALDSDVIKTYVEIGLGIGLLAKMAYDPVRDINLRMIDVGHLFPTSTTWIGIRRGEYLRNYIYDFIELFAPQLNRDALKAALNLE